MPGKPGGRCLASYGRASASGGHLGAGGCGYEGAGKGEGVPPEGGFSAGAARALARAVRGFGLGFGAARVRRCPGGRGRRGAAR